MANNLPGLRGAIGNALVTYLDATTLAKLRDSYVVNHQGEWDQRRMQGIADTVANRNNFAMDKLMDSLIAEYNSGIRRMQLQALPPPEVLQ